MTTRAEMIGAALARAVKKTAAAMTESNKGDAPEKGAGREQGAAPEQGATPEKGAAPRKGAMYRTNLRDVPPVGGLKRDDGWVDMQVQFLIDKASAGADHVIGWTVLKPGARHERHLHRNCDEFFIVLKGQGHIYTDHGEVPSIEGDVVYSPRNCPHGFNNTSDHDVVLVWGWMGAGSIEASGYEVS
jgi:mannose-6-phosphate isomerase-like protein (cupin superfamily)